MYFMEDKSNDASTGMYRDFDEVSDGIIIFTAHGVSDKVFEKAMTPEYYKDENGKQVEQPKTSWGYDDFNIDIYAAKQEEVDAVKAIIDSAEKAYSPSNEELTKIVNEEAAAFFGIPLHSEKEILMMVVEKDIRDNVLNALYKEMGMAKKAQGIVFAIPVDESAGLDSAQTQREK